MQRYKCGKCGKFLSDATFSRCYRQKKRLLNPSVFCLLTIGVSQRDTARSLGINLKTVARKLEFLARWGAVLNEQYQNRFPPAQATNWDELETFEHSKCKPVSVPILVEEKTFRLIAFGVAVMPAKGKLAKIARAKYGVREDQRHHVRTSVLKRSKSWLKDDVRISSDKHPSYGPEIRSIFPHAEHIAYKGRRGCVVGQGELKKIGFDPLFAINHTCAQARSDIKRLARRTWCTTKKVSALFNHFTLFQLKTNLHHENRRKKNKDRLVADFLRNSFC